MSSTITGVGSGFDINGWVSQLVAAKQQSTVTPLESKLKTLQTKSSAISSLKGKYSTLQSAIQTFTKTMYNSSSDMWANASITSSNSAYATATSSGSVAAAKVELEIEQIATATTAKSAKSLGAISKENIENAKFEDLANGQAKAGAFSIFLDGKEYEIEIDSEDTVKNVIDKIGEATKGKVQASVSEDGKFSIKAYKEGTDENGNPIFEVNKDAQLLIGSSADTSNIVSALKLYEQEGTHGYSSSYTISTVNTSAAMASAESGLGEIRFFDSEGNEAESGTVSINGVDFTITKDTTLNELISNINGNAETNVKASYDSLTNKIILTSTETGQNNISLTGEGTNLLNVLGFTEGEGENEVLAKGSQTLGQNAIAYINGNKVISTSNTITGESSGIANLSITIKKPTSEYSKIAEDDRNVTLEIETDHTAVKEALQKFVDAYNDVVSTTRTLTSSDGTIGNDSTLNSIITQIRNITSSVNDNTGAFSMLSQIGISTSRTDAIKLTIDNSKLDEALNENYESVKKLLSDGYTNKEDTGLFDNLLTTVSQVLNSENGYFTNATESIQNQITNMNTRIERANTKLLKYETRITEQFNRMDTVIAQLNAQLSTFSSYI